MVDVKVGNCHLMLGDCLQRLKELPDKSIDLILTDPPYGIGEANGKNKSRGGSAAPPTDFGVADWDNKIPEKVYFDEMLRVSKHAIIFGGNFFIEFLSNSSCWIVWDKDNGANDFADCELAWTNFPTAVRKFKWRWNGMLQEKMDSSKEKRVHPTQKPVPLMEWILKNYSKEGELVLDCFMGSGTTGVACARLERRFIGIEKDEKYYELACKRIEDVVLVRKLREF